MHKLRAQLPNPKPRGLSWRLYVSRGLGRRLSLLGERLRVPWLIYNPLQFQNFHERALANAPAVIRAFRAALPEAVTLLDVGAGSGAYAAEAQRAGFNVLACEHSRAGRRLAEKQGVRSIPFDLESRQPAATGPEYDLAYCFEVGEHLPPDLGDRLVRFIASQAPRVVFTAAQPGQGGTGHINEQPKEYWIERFERCGMTVDPRLSSELADRFAREGVSAPYLIHNVMVFESGSGRSAARVAPGTD